MSCRHTANGFTPMIMDGAGALRSWFPTQVGVPTTPVAAGSTLTMDGIGNPDIPGGMSRFTMVVGGGMPDLGGCGTPIWCGLHRGCHSGPTILIVDGPHSPQGLISGQVQDFTILASGFRLDLALD